VVGRSAITIDFLMIYAELLILIAVLC